MENNGQNNIFYCPFCADEFRAEEILFVDEDMIGTVANESEYDPAQYKLMQRIVTYQETTKENNENRIQMERRPKYKYHRWHAVDNLPFYKPIDIIFPKEYASPIPTDILIYRNKGMTPKQLSNDEPAPWAQTSAVVEEEEEKTSEQENKISTGNVFKDMFLNGMANQQNNVQTAVVEQSIMPDEATKRLTKKACPRCHCLLPDKFGAIPAFRIAMLGGTASGKTTYMLAVANLLEQMSGLPAGIINGCQLSTESKRHFDFLIKCLEHDKLGATKKEDATIIRFAFPIVMNMTTVTDDGQNEREFILIINDIPGEGMEEKDFLMSYPGLLKANAAIMLIDPVQFTGGDKKKKMIQGDMEAVGRNPDDPKEYKDYALSFTPITFDKTLNNIKSIIVGERFKELKSLTMVLNKLDLLYDKKCQVLDVIADKSLRCVNGQNDLNMQHEEGMDMEFVQQMSRQVENYIIENKLQCKTYSTSLKQMREKLPEPIYTLCISIRCWVQGKGAFDSLRRDGFIDKTEIIGFRMMEPLLVSLANLHLVRTKEHTEPEIDEELRIPWWKRLFGIS